MRDRAQMGPSDLRLALPLVGLAVLATILTHVYNAEDLTLKPTPEAASQLYLIPAWRELLPVAGVVLALAVVIHLVARSGVAPTRVQGGDDE